MVIISMQKLNIHFIQILRSLVYLQIFIKSNRTDEVVCIKRIHTKHTVFVLPFAYTIPPTKTRLESKNVGITLYFYPGRVVADLFPCLSPSFLPSHFRLRYLFLLSSNWKGEFFQERKQDKNSSTCVEVNSRLWVRRIYFFAKFTLSLRTFTRSHSLLGNVYACTEGNEKRQQKRRR